MALIRPYPSPLTDLRISVPKSLYSMLRASAPVREFTDRSRPIQVAGSAPTQPALMNRSDAIPDLETI